jgi:hypothetical protein
MKRRDPEQMSLYPLARNSDMETSHQAARQLRVSGLHAKQKTWVLALVMAHPGLTARELAQMTDNPLLNHPIIWRRLPDLEKDGWVMKGAVSNRRRPAVTWYPRQDVEAS